MGGRLDQNLCANWDVLLGEACSDALMELREVDEEYVAAMQRQQAAADALRQLVEDAQLDEPHKTEMMEHLDTLRYEVAVQCEQACFLAGAGVGIRLAHQLGLLKL